MRKRKKGLIFIKNNGRHQKKRAEQFIILKLSITNITSSKAAFIGLFCIH